MDSLPRALQYLLGFAKGNDFLLMARAVTYAYLGHKGQNRKNGKSLISHPASVCQCLISHDLGSDEVLMAAALMHDLIEDPAVTQADLAAEFSPSITELVVRVTKTPGRNLAEYYKGIAQDPKAVLLKAADRACNVGDMIDTYSPQHLRRYVNETRKYVLPLMKQLRWGQPQYGDALVALKDRIEDVLRAVVAYLSVVTERDKLRKKLARRQTRRKARRN